MKERNPERILFVLISITLFSCSSSKRIENSIKTDNAGRINLDISEISNKIRREITSSTLSGILSATIIDYDTSIFIMDSSGVTTNPVRRRIGVNVDLSKTDEGEVEEETDKSRNESADLGFHERKDEFVNTEVEKTSPFHILKVTGALFVIAFLVLFLLRVIKYLRK